MRGLKKHHLIFTSLILCLIAFIVPFFLRNTNETLFSVLSLSLTAVGSIATVATLIIAIFLYDRFGLEAKFIEKQTDKVLELADNLKGKTFIAQAYEFKYMVRPSKVQLTLILNHKLYEGDLKKKVLISENYYPSLDNIMAIRRSYWLPKEIKEKMTFLEFAATMKMTNPPEEKEYIKIEYKNDSEQAWGLAFPEMTFGEFLNNLYNLVDEIEKWLKKHSDIQIDLKLEERNQ